MAIADCAIRKRLAWDEVDEAFDAQIQVAKSTGYESAIPELKELRDRLATGYATGSVPPHPAEIYDRNVEAAIRRLLPSAEVRRQARSREVADFIVEESGNRLFVETKWRSNPERQFGGSTLPQLLSRLPQDARLLVVTNTTDPPSLSASEMVKQALSRRGRIVQWRSVRDDLVLGEALLSLIGPAPDAPGHPTPVQAR